MREKKGGGGGEGNLLLSSLSLQPLDAVPGLPDSNARLLKSAVGITLGLLGGGNTGAGSGDGGVFGGGAVEEAVAQAGAALGRGRGRRVVMVPVVIGHRRVGGARAEERHGDGDCDVSGKWRRERGLGMRGLWRLFESWRCEVLVEEEEDVGSERGLYVSIHQLNAGSSVPKSGFRDLGTRVGASVGKPYDVNHHLFRRPNGRASPGSSFC